MKLQYTNIMSKSLQKNEGNLSVVPQCTTQFEKHLIY